MANITATCPVCGKVFTRPCKPRPDGRYLCGRACAAFLCAAYRDDLSNAQLQWAKDVLYEEAKQCGDASGRGND